MTGAPIAACPSCLAENPRRIGALPEARVFAGADTTEALPASSLYRCRACGLLFRHPVLTAREYDALYANAQAACWPDEPGRADWSLIAEYLERHAPAGASVLDFGCHTGGLLRRLGPRYAKTGVEINEAAARTARQTTGAKVVPVLTSLPAGERFDYVTAVDTIEHFPDPGTVIASLLDVVKPGGALLVTTGDAESPLWKIAGARWWYCFFPEHLAFVSEPWMRDWLRRAGSDARVAEVRRFRHIRLSPMRYALHACLLLPYLASPGAYAVLIGALRRMFGRDVPVYPPGTGLTRDHIFLAIRKAQ
jgi:SAM-dependent methyltransferase